MKLEESLNKMLDIEPVEIENGKEIVKSPYNNPVTVTPMVSPLENNIQDDFEFSRNMLKSLLTSGTAALEEIRAVAKESEVARDYEVTADMIKTLTDTTVQILELHKKMSEAGAVKKHESDHSVNIEKAVFVGSPAELLRQVKKADENP